MLFSTGQLCGAPLRIVTFNTDATLVSPTPGDPGSTTSFCRVQAWLFTP